MASSLAEQLRSLSTPEPSRFDLDEDEFDVTRAQTIDKRDDDGDIESETVSATSDLRKKTAPILQDIDKKYAGRKVSRAQIEASRSQHVEDSVREVGDELESDSEGTKQFNCDRNVRWIPKYFSLNWSKHARGCKSGELPSARNLIGYKNLLFFAPG